MAPARGVLWNRPVTALAAPDLRLHTSWAAAVAEFGDEVQHGSGLWDFDHVDVTEDGCRTVVAHLLAQADPATELAPNLVHCTYFWITDDSTGSEEFVGYLALRHSLTPWLLEEGGHIGYSVRPSRRREGHATRALRLSLEHAAGARHRPRAGHLRRGQRRLAADDRGRRRGLRGLPQRQAPLLDPNGLKGSGK